LPGGDGVPAGKWAAQGGGAMKRAWRLAGLVIGLAAMLGGLTSCAEPPGRVDAFFVRQGLVVEARGLEGVSAARDGRVLAAWGGGGQTGRVLLLGPGRVWLVVDWRPGQRWTVEATTGQGKRRLGLTAPQRPSPLLVSRVDLEPVDPSNPEMGGGPDTEVRFSPDGGRLAIGSFQGWLRVVDALSGRELFARKMAEGMVKRIAWGRQGGREVLYVGEQSPDGFLYCLDAANGREIWRYRTADDIETASVSPDDNRNRIYNLPGVYQLRALPGGGVVALGTHGWRRQGKWLNKCLVYGFSGRRGRLKWRWPAKRTFPHSICWFGLSASGRLLAFTSHRSLRSGRSGPEFPGGSLYCLNGVAGGLLWKYRIPPLEPYYRRASTWQGVTVAPDGKHVFLGLNDGRGMLFAGRPPQPPGPLWVRDLGTPVMVGDIPVAAPISYAVMSNRVIYLTLPSTIIPASTGSQRNRRPVPHPLSNYLVALDLSGRTLWRWRCPGSPQGVFLSRGGRWVATAVTSRRGSPDTDLFGLSLFDTTRPGGGAGKLVYHYATEGPLHFQAAFSPDGRFIAITEFPYSLDEGKNVHGRYRVHILH